MRKLFTPLTIGQLTLKNRIVMSPMCMYAAADDGLVTEWHELHYSSRAVGQVGLIILESTGVCKNGRISRKDLGIWNDDQIEGLHRLVQKVHRNGAAVGIQLSHAGRKAEVDVTPIAPSAIRYNEKYPIPEEMSLEDIKQVVQQFKEAARRSKEAGFDLIEIHGAHGYLIHQFLSPLANKRKDEYGGSAEERYRFLSEVVSAVQKEWDGPLFVRLSLEEYHSEGNSLSDYSYIVNSLKKQGVDLIDCSSGAIVPAYIDVYPGYQVPLAEWVKKEISMPSSAVGLITSALQAEEILKNGRADLIFIGRELLRNPYWPLAAASELNTTIDFPSSYRLGWREIFSKNQPQEIWAPGKEKVKTGG